ncbi:MAG: metal-dependent transcriptional regulator [Candidatus Diapherotrites archaeon]|nr:metal-dependent transcriptional regulator [Candidatus Diapherotrites archaeon]
MRVACGKIILERSRENEEMYLKAVWLLEEEGFKPIHAGEVAKLLNISIPSTTEMLHKLGKKGFLQYSGRAGILLKPRGRKRAEKIVRNLRLAEVWLEQVLQIKDQDVACRFEHIFTEPVVRALRRTLKNPLQCPHGKKIPAI